VGGLGKIKRRRAVDVVLSCEVASQLCYRVSPPKILYLLYPSLAHMVRRAKRAFSWCFGAGWNPFKGASHDSAEQESVRKFDKCHGGNTSDVDIVQR